MDTFIDKLTQKLVAQEMIKANAAADAAELHKTRTQVMQYEELLSEIKGLNAVNTESAKQVNRIVEESLRKLEDTERIDRILEESIQKIREIQQSGQDLEKLEEKLTSLKDSFTPLFEELTEHVHKENVKVYRNVQAVLVEELAKTNESLASGMKAVSGRVTAVFFIALASFLTSAATIIFLLFSHFKLI